jgi:hypothetical protein
MVRAEVRLIFVDRMKNPLGLMWELVWVDLGIGLASFALSGGQGELLV